MTKRQIKFRAWDKKLRVMYPGIGLSKLLFYLLFQDFPNATAYLEIKDHFGEIVWLQFTGFLDKGGKGIYEGDIVEGNPIGWSGNMLGHVIWMNDGWFVDPDDERDNEKRLHGDFFGRLKILGNMYENPELLEKGESND